MLVAAEMTFAGVPTMKVPDNWPGYDLIAQPCGGGSPLRISVKSRRFKRGGDTFVTYSAEDDFDWLAIVLLPGADQAHRRIFIVPRDIADANARPGSKVADKREWRQDEVKKRFPEFEDNFSLSRVERQPASPESVTGRMNPNELLKKI